MSLLHDFWNTDWNATISDGIGKMCHLLEKFEYQLNMDLEKSKEASILQLYEMEDFRKEVHNSASIYKERTKQRHNKKLFLGKLKSA